jgi:hypothetical protein
MKAIKFDSLGYYERSNGMFRDLRSAEVKLPKMRWARISINGQYRLGKAYVDMHKHANPGWTFGFQWAFINWTHHKNHCCHFGIDIARRGITFSEGKRLFR